MQTVTEGIKLRQITKKVKAHHGLLWTQEGDVVVMNIDNGEVIKPEDEKTQAERNQKRASDETAAKHVEMSDAEFADIKRRFEHTITTTVTKGSVCLETHIKVINNIAYKFCHPPTPKFW